MMTSPNSVGVFEVFERTLQQPNTEAKVACLQQLGNNYAVRTILQGCFHPAVQFNIPNGAPPYSQQDGTQVETRLHYFAKKLDYFVVGSQRVVKNDTKRQLMFIEMLESVHPKDAEILINMKDKKPPVKGITENLVRKAFPDLLPEKGEDVTPLRELTEEEKAMALFEAQEAERNAHQAELNALTPEGQMAMPASDMGLPNTPHARPAPTVTPKKSGPAEDLSDAQAELNSLTPEGQIATFTEGEPDDFAPKVVEEAVDKPKPKRKTKAKPKAKTKRKPRAKKSD